MIAAASAAPVQRNAKTMPRGASSWPIGPCVPNEHAAARSPTTTGGSTSGRCTNASKSVLPGSACARGRRPRRSASGRLADDADHADLEAERDAPPARRRGHRVSSERRSRAARRCRALPRRARKAAKPSAAAVRAAQHHHRIDDRRCDGWRGEGVRRCARAARPARRCDRRCRAALRRAPPARAPRARSLRARAFLAPRPGAERLERGASRICPRAPTSGSAIARRPSPSAAGEREARRDAAAAAPARRRDQDERVVERGSRARPAASLRDFDVVDPVRRRREMKMSAGRAGLDLPARAPRTPA